MKELLCNSKPETENKKTFPPNYYRLSTWIVPRLQTTLTAQ